MMMKLKFLGVGLALGGGNCFHLYETTGLMKGTSLGSYIWVITLSRQLLPAPHHCTQSQRKNRKYL